VAAAVHELAAVLADPAADVGGDGLELFDAARARAAVDADGKSRAAHDANLWTSAAIQTPAQSTIESSTAALPMSFARLDKSCRSGPMRSMAVSTAVFSSSTISTSSTEPASNAASIQLRPSHS